MDAIADVEEYSAPLAGYTVLYFNLRRAPFFDRSVRQAIAHAIDRDYLANDVQGGMADPLEGPVLPVSWAHSPNVPRYLYDPETSRAFAWTRQAGLSARMACGLEGKPVSR